MKLVRSITALRRALEDPRRRGERVGFVPTMGALHEGHLSLVRRCRAANDRCVVSIFVNPAQFGPNEDFERYPREEKKDKALLRNENVDILFLPTVQEMYPDRYATYVEVEEMTNTLCGAFRPGHFRGVTTVVTKLLNCVRPQVLYLGQKDAQQALVIARMVKDLNMDIRVKICPTVRHRDGLALSSRNQYLTPEQRGEAPVLYQALRQLRQRVKKGETDAARLIREARTFIRQNSSARVEYFACVDTEDLRPVSRVRRGTMAAVAAYFGQTRLIDNIIIS